MHRKFIGLLVLAIVLALSGLIMLITGIVLLTHDKSCDETSPQSDTDRCSYSDEAARSGLDRFLQKVKDSYYRLHPNKIAWKDGVTPSEIREKYRSYDPSPRNIKLITDESWALLKEINEAGINAAKLKPREKKSVAQVKHYLQHVFGNPYEVNYYAGDFLMGPNLWCWQPLCDLPYDFRKSLQYFKPINANDLETLGEKLAEVNQTFTQYRKNMEYGVTAGMVRSVEQCLAGINGLTSTFRHISSKGAIGVFDESFVKNLLQPEFLIDLTNDTDEARSWETKYGKSANESLRGFLLDSVGKPIEDFFTFLRTENLQHCVSNDVSSGFATLPLPFVYVNNTADKSRPTTKSLPTGEPLNGTKSYAQIVTFFTTNSMTPDEIHQLGFKMLNELYPQVLEVARIITEKKDNDTAKLEFIKRMNASDLYFNNEEIPKNESDERAHVLCGDVEGAKKYCPTRWRAIQNWFAEAHMALSFLDPKTIKMFHFNGAKHTTPNCPIEMSPHFNPSRGANYNGADEKCSTNARYNLPFFSEKPGPRYEEWSTNAHEGRPGHHTQVQGLIEHFRDSCGGVIKWLDEETYYTAFSEGWGLYAENPLVAQDTDTYNGKPWQKYGMLKWQVWRALRLIVDTGLHYKGFSRQKALQFFADFAWDKSGTALKEVTRYQSAPGQATAYMIGQQHIKKLRDYSEGKLGDQFNLRDFHYQLLSQGSSPLSYLQLSIEAYVDCVKDEKAAGCYDVLNPAVKDDDAEDDDVINSEDGEAIKRPRPHYV